VHISKLTVSTALGLAVTACGGGSSVGSGTLNLNVTDAPIDEAGKVVVTFSGVELQPADGERIRIDFAETKQIDLLALQNGLSLPLLEGQELASGRYNWLRLMLTEGGNYLTKYGDDAQYPLRIPSGAETGLKLVSGFVVPHGASADLIVDFDLRRSVHYAVGPAEYMLRPTLRLVDNAEAGAIAGSIDLTMTHDQACGPGNAVYVFAGANVTPNDVNGKAPQPLTTALAHLADDGGCRYHAAFLPAGDYTVAFTAKAMTDDPVQNDDLAFAPSATVPVTAGEISVHNFTMP